MKSTAGVCEFSSVTGARLLSLGINKTGQSKKEKDSAAALKEIASVNEHLDEVLEEVRGLRDRK